MCVIVQICLQQGWQEVSANIFHLSRLDGDGGVLKLLQWIMIIQMVVYSREISKKNLI